MEFKQKVLDYFKEHDVTVTRTEMPDEDYPSIVCHVPITDNIKIANLKDTMEPVLGVMIAQSDLGGFNVVVVELIDDENV